MATNVDAIDLHQEHAKSNYLERAFLSSPNQIRLIGDLRRTAVRLSTYRSRWQGEAPYKAALLAFSKARQALYQRDFEGGWKCLAETERLELFLMEKEELAAKCVIIDEQGKAKLNGWRADAFKRIMKKMDGSATPERLGQALSMITDSQETKFYSIGLMRRQGNLVSSLLIVLSLIFLAVARGFPDLQQSLSHDALSLSGGYWVLLGSFVLGAIGACVSALISFSTPQVMRIPDRIMDSIITLVRPVIGGASALISTFLLLSGVIRGDQLNLAFLFVVAFAFGFSERLVISTVSRIGSKQ
jgi:hypothetical protein